MKPGAIIMMTMGKCIVFMLLTFTLQAQQPVVKRISIHEAITVAKNNLQYDMNNQQIEKGKLQTNTVSVFSKTGVFAENEDMRPSDNKGILKIGISQNIAWPGLHKAQKNLYNEQLKYYQANTAAIDADIKREVRSVYYQLWYLQNKQQLFQRLDSIYQSLNEAVRLKVKTGDSPGLDSIAAGVRVKELQALQQQNMNNIHIQQQSLMQLLNTGDSILPISFPLEKLPVTVILVDSIHPLLALQTQNINIANAGISVTQNENKPEFSGRFYSQRLYGMADPFSGFSFTAAFPLLGAGANRNKVKAAESEAILQQKQYAYNRQMFGTRQMQVQQEMEKNKSLLSFYETTGLRQAGEIIKAVSLAYRIGEISFAELTQFLTQGIDIQKNYLEVLNAYNQSVIQYYYFINQ